MTPYMAYKMILSLKLHFTSAKYNIFEMRNMKAVKASEEAFEKRNDKFRIQAIAKEYKDSEIRDICVANYMYDLKWTPFDPQTIPRYQKYKAYKDARAYHFKQEVSNLYENCGCRTADEIFKLKDGNALIMEAYLAKQISTDTLVILDKLHQFMGDLLGNAVFAAMLERVVKYAPFVKVDLEKFTEIEKALQEEFFQSTC